MSPLRAPFTRFQWTSGPAELAEKVRGSGARKAVGALRTCPFCLGRGSLPPSRSRSWWRPGRPGLAASVLTVVAGADVLQLVYASLE